MHVFELSFLFFALHEVISVTDEVEVKLERFSLISTVYLILVSTYCVACPSTRLEDLGLDLDHNAQKISAFTRLKKMLVKTLAHLHLVQKATTAKS